VAEEDIVLDFFGHTQPSFRSRGKGNSLKPQILYKLMRLMGRSILMRRE